jgi:hypothetical protein
MTIPIREDIANMKTYLLQGVCSREAIRKGKGSRPERTRLMAQIPLAALIILEVQEAPTILGDPDNRVGAIGEVVLEAQAVREDQGALGGREVQGDQECQMHRSRPIVSYLMVLKFPLSKLS